MKKKILICAMAVVCAACLTLTACGSSEEVIIMSDDGTMVTFEEEDEIEEGMYVKTEEGFNPLLYTGETTTYQWWTDYDQLVPELTDDDELVLFTTEKVPESLTFWKMTDFGYTVGIKFTQTNEGYLTFPSNDSEYCPESPVGTYVLENTFSDVDMSAVRIVEVNGKEFKETMLTVDGFMKGLTKDAMYRFYYYAGTVYDNINIKADTHVFIEDYDLTTGSYSEAKGTYFIVDLPAGIESGYWYIEDYGMIHYTGEDTDLIINSSEDEDMNIEETKDEQNLEQDVSEAEAAKEESEAAEKEAEASLEETKEIEAQDEAQAQEAEVEADIADEEAQEAENEARSISSQSD